LLIWNRPDEILVGRDDKHYYTLLRFRDFGEINEDIAYRAYDLDGKIRAHYLIEDTTLYSSEVRDNLLYITDFNSVRIFRLEESPAKAVAVARTAGVSVDGTPLLVGVEKELSLAAALALEEASAMDILGECTLESKLLVTIKEYASKIKVLGITEAKLLARARELADRFCIQGAQANTNLANDTDAALDYTVEQGAARFDVAYSGLELRVITTNTLVTSAGTNDFAVGYDPASNTSIVQNYAGSVSVQAVGSPISITLAAWHQITVTGSILGSVTKMTSYAYLPSVSNPEPPVAPPPPCTPGPIGESNNIADAITICNGQTVSGQVSEADLDDVYQILGTAGQQVTVNLEGTGGNANLYIFAPGADDVTTDPATSSSATSDSNEFIQFVLPESGFWYIDVFEAAGTTEYTLTATLSSAAMATQTTEVANSVPKE
jgi:hypothetical protein